MDHLLTKEDVITLLRISESRFRGLRNSSDFPAPLTLGPRTFRWTRESITEWIAAR